MHRAEPQSVSASRFLRSIERMYLVLELDFSSAKSLLEVFWKTRVEPDFHRQFGQGYRVTVFREAYRFWKGETASDEKGQYLDVFMESLPGSNSQSLRTLKSILELQTDLRIAVLLVYVEELSYAEAAEILGLERGEIARKLAAARLLFNALDA